MKKKQKEIFLESEGNSWFDRNHKAIQEREINLQFPIVQGLSKCLDKKAPNGNKQLLEIGCGEGKTLHWIAENFGLQCYGVEPSEKAVELANTKDVQVIRGTADVLDFEDKKFTKISIFMNVFDCHVNRTPCEGKISEIFYKPGKFLNASLDKASEDNERNYYKITNNSGEDIIVVQIAGLIARRIVCESSKDQELKQGDRIGMIRFGSRADVYFENFKPLVKVGQTTVAGETLLAKR